MFGNRKNKTIKKYFPALPVEVLALEAFFEEMSEKGFLVVGNSNIYYEFEVCEPKKRRFHVEYFIKASIFDSNPEKHTQEFIDYCEVAGWKYCFSNGKMQCFCTEDTQSPDIETDDQFRFQSIIKATVSSQFMIWLLGVLYLFMGISQGINIIKHHYLFSGFLTSSIAMGLSVFFSIFIINSLLSFVDVLKFYFRNKRNLAVGDPLELFGSNKSKRRMYGRLIFLSIMSIGLAFIALNNQKLVIVMTFTFVIMMAVILLQGRFMKSRMSNRSTNIVMTVLMTFVMLQLFWFLVIGTLFIGKNVLLGSNSITFYEQDEVPITLDKLGFYPASDYKYRESELDFKETLLASELSFSDNYVPPSGFRRDNDSEVLYPYMQVSVFESNYKIIFEKYVELYIADRIKYGIKEMEDKTLHDQGYKVYIAVVNGGDQLLLVKDEKAIHIICNQTLTGEGINLILMRLSDAS